MMWKGVFSGALIGLLITQRPWGAVIGAIIGLLFDQGAAVRAGPGADPAGASLSIPEEFFRTTFELMGHVAKSDGRVTEEEIDAARRLMREMNLGEREISAAIA